MHTCVIIGLYIGKSQLFVGTEDVPLRMYVWRCTSGGIYVPCAR